MHYLYYPLFLVLLLLSACKKDGADPADNRTFVPGEVLVGFKPNASLPAVFQFANSQGLSIKSMSGFFYQTQLPNSSLADINTEVKSKPYFLNGGYCSAQIFTTDNKIHVFPSFGEMNLANQQDWLATATKLQLTENFSGPWVSLQVPVGQERKWESALASNSLAEWSQLNYVGGFMLH